MKITIATLGTRGDVQPCIAVGLGLQASGHEVKIAVPVDYKDLVLEKGLGFFPIRNSFRQIFEREPGGSRLKEELSPIRMLCQRRSVVEPVVDQIFSDLWSSCQGADVVLYSILALPAYYFAKDLDLPAFPICMQPLSRTRAFPSVLFSPNSLNMEFINKASYILAEQSLWGFIRPYFVRWRKKLGLSSVPFWGHFKQFNGENNPIFNGYSPLVVPKPSDWGNRMYVTGYWFLDDSSGDWRPPPELLDFLESGPPPVCFGFGSMNDNRVENRIRLSIEALKKTKTRGIFLTGKSDLNREELSLNDDIFVSSEIPHSWLFPRVSAIIHHGGAGTTAAAIRAGIPSIIIPFFFDQLFWGRQLRDLGVGPKPIDRKRLSVETLSLALQETLSNYGFQGRLQTLSSQVKAENGVQVAVDNFHQELARI